MLHFAGGHFLHSEIRAMGPLFVGTVVIAGVFMVYINLDLKTEE